MYVCGVDTEELYNQINKKREQRIAVNKKTLGPLLGLLPEQCDDDDIVWAALQRLIWYMDRDNVWRMTQADKPMEMEENQSVEDTSDHFTYDDITYPAHYAGNNKITCKDAFNSMMYPLEGVITPKVGYWLGCAFTYLWRAFLKGNPEKDLKKCKQCINEMLNLM